MPSATSDRGHEAALRWAGARTYRHDDFPEEELLGDRAVSISVCLPAREEAVTIGPIVHELAGLRERGLIDEVVVVDADSEDGTAAVAARAGAIVHQQRTLRPEFGPVLGKGDAMWRALSVLTGDIVAFVDGDSEHFGGHYVRGLVGPLLRDRDVHFVKGSYRRPFKAGDVQLPDGGGRVNELTARPLLNRFYPELAAVRQPLTGEFAARRDLLERLPFFTGYGVEIGLLIDAYRVVGLDGLAQVDLGVRQNRHQSLSALGPMAAAVLGALARRLEREGRLPGRGADGFLVADGAGAGMGTEVHDLRLAERPPMTSLAGPPVPAVADRRATG